VNNIDNSKGQINSRSLVVSSAKYDSPDDSPMQLTISRRFESRVRSLSCACIVNEHLWTGDYNGKIDIWNRNTGAQLFSVPRAHKERIYKLLYACGRAWSSSATEVCVWSANAKRITVFKLEKEEAWSLARVHTTDVNHVWAFCKDSLGETSKINVWCAKTLAFKKRFRFPDTAIGCVQQYKNSVWIVGLDCVIRFNPVTFQRDFVLKVGLGMINGLVCHRQFIWISSTFTSKLCVWDYQAREQIEVLSGHDDKIVDVVKVAHFVLSCGLDGKLLVWDLNTNQFVKEIPSTHAEPISEILFAAKTNCVISTSKHLLVCWDPIIQ